MRVTHNIKKLKKVKLIKQGLGIGIITASLLLGGCGSNTEYYLVVENGQSYICTKNDKYTNYDDYDFVSITDEKVIGSICSNRGSFDYNNHRLSINFLNELQVIPLKDVFEEENIDDSALNDSKQLISVANSSNLDKIAFNHYTKMKYEINKKFIYGEPSKLEIFVSDNDVMIGYDVLSDRVLQKNKYIYSIYDMDVIQFNSNEKIQNISIGLYLTDEQKERGYLTYNEAIGMVNNYIKYHFHQKTKVLK